MILLIVRFAVHDGLQCKRLVWSLFTECMSLISSDFVDRLYNTSKWPLLIIRSTERMSRSHYLTARMSLRLPFVGIHVLQTSLVTRVWQKSVLSMLSLVVLKQDRRMFVVAKSHFICILAADYHLAVKSFCVTVIAYWLFIRKKYLIGSPWELLFIILIMLSANFFLICVT